MVTEISWWIRARKRSHCADVDFFNYLYFSDIFLCVLPTFLHKSQIILQQTFFFFFFFTFYCTSGGNYHFFFIWPPSQHHKTDLNLSVHISSLPLLFFILLMFCCFLWSFTNNKCHYWSSWEWDLTISYMCGAFRNSWDTSLQIPPLSFHRRWCFYVHMTRGSVRFEQKWLVELSTLSKSDLTKLRTEVCHDTVTTPIVTCDTLQHLTAELTWKVYLQAGWWRCDWEHRDSGRTYFMFFFKPFNPDAFQNISHVSPGCLSSSYNIRRVKALERKSVMIMQSKIQSRYRDDVQSFSQKVFNVWTQTLLKKKKKR